MAAVDSASVRRTFLDFFSSRGHTIVPTSSLVPDDPTLLLTNAGMVQFKPFFLGRREPPYPRAASVQKCFRAVDLEEVGSTARHLTFFEMLGNFSFGDYFKTDACRWAWELVTSHLGLDQSRLWVTVFETDDDCARIWEEEVGVEGARILRRGREDNFWHMGVAGPCGPSSELLYDRGESFGAELGPDGKVDGERYLEIWNLVFMSSVQDDAGNLVGDLPKPSVDTGAGLERIAAILQGTRSAFETDTMAPVLSAVEDVTGRRYGAEASSDVSLRILCDHARAMTMLVSDGVLPSNEGRGYVLRRLIRRAVRHARLAGIDRPLLGELIAPVMDLFAPVYPEVDRSRDLVRRVVEGEESRFDLTLRRGLGLLEDELAAAKRRGELKLSGALVFKLHDTHGFPVDLAAEIAAEEGLQIDREEFEVLMAEQRHRAKAAQTAPAGGGAVMSKALAGESEFLGYEKRRAEAKVMGILVPAGASAGELASLSEGQEGEIVLDRTVFYPEGGGQVGDRGEIVTATGTFLVADTQKRDSGIIVHSGKVVSGEVTSGQEAEAAVEPAHRQGAQQSHTATHMMHWALRDALGTHVRQQGSLVEPGRMRFDFSHFEAVPSEVMSRIEEEVNHRVLADDPVRAFETTYDYATSLGAMALFGEKYGDHVRVVEVGDYSKELCGGTHVVRTGQVGVIKILGESSIGAGIRRIEAYTGPAGLGYLNRQAERLRQVAELLKSDPEQVVERLERTLETIRSLTAELNAQRAAGQKEEVAAVLATGTLPLGTGSRLVQLRRDGRLVDELRKLVIALRDAIGSGVVIVGAAGGGRANIVVGVSPDLVAAGVSAQAVLSAAAPFLGGGGGGKPDLAVGGGTSVEGVDQALKAASEAARAAIG